MFNSPCHILTAKASMRVPRQRVTLIRVRMRPSWILSLRLRKGVITKRAKIARHLL